MSFFDFMTFLVLLIVVVVAYKGYSKKLKSTSLGIIAQEVDNTLLTSAMKLAEWNADTIGEINFDSVKDSKKKLEKLRELYK